MSVEENKAVVQRFFDEFQNAKKEEVLYELVAPEYEGTKEPGQTGGNSGPAAFKQVMRMGLKAIPDLHVTVHDLIAEGDRVVATLTLKGTHTGPYFGLPATGRQFSIAVIDVYRVVDGKIVEGWSVIDALAFFNQLGLVPSFAELARVDEWEPD
jgi:steroid delta-isomerase-like uncharacterized protein